MPRKETPPRAPRPKPSGFGVDVPFWSLIGFVPTPTFAPTSRSTGPSACASRVIISVPAQNANAATEIEALLMGASLLGFGKWTDASQIGGSPIASPSQDRILHGLRRTFPLPGRRGLSDPPDSTRGPACL